MMSLSARSLWILAAIAALGILGTWNPQSVGSAWKFLLLLYVLMLIADRFLLRQREFLVHRQAPLVVELGREFELSYALSSNRPEQLRYADQLPRALDQVQLTGELALVDAAVVRHRVLAAELGVVGASAFALARRGVLGLAWWREERVLPGRLWVVPQRLTSAEARTLTRKAGETPTRRNGPGLELLMLRDYVPGDPPRHIDWKATARSGSPKVRVMTELNELELLCLIDCGRSARIAADRLRRFELRINTVSRLAQVALSHGDRMGVVAYADKPLLVLPQHRGHAGLTRIERGLAGLRAEGVESDLGLAIAAARPLLSRRCLIVFFSDFDSEPAARQLLAAVNMLKGKHLPLITAVDEPALHAMHHRDDPDWTTPFANLAAADQLSRERRVHEHLARLGARVVLATPDTLDRKVLASYAETRRRRRA